MKLGTFERQFCSKTGASAVRFFMVQVHHVFVANPRCVFRLTAVLYQLPDDKESRNGNACSINITRKRRLEPPFGVYSNAWPCSDRLAVSPISDRASACQNAIWNSVPGCFESGTVKSCRLPKSILLISCLSLLPYVRFRPRPIALLNELISQTRFSLTCVDQQITSKSNSCSS